MNISDKYYHQTPNGYVYFASAEVEAKARELCSSDGYIPDYESLDDVGTPRWHRYREKAAMKLWSALNGD